MAIAPLQAESVSANPAPLSLYSASIALEQLALDLDNLSALVSVASCDSDMDKLHSKALQAIASRIDALSSAAARESNAYIAASRTAGLGR